MQWNERTKTRLMRGIEYIERHISEDITLVDIAASAALSEYHFHRLFRSHFGVPVMDYVRRRRLAKAASALLRSRARILEMALDADFQSQAAFSRAFRKVYHTTPAIYRKRGREVPWLSSAPINDRMLALLPGLSTGQPRFELIDAFDTLGLETSIDGAGRDQIPFLWQRLSETIGPAAYVRAERIGISSGGSEALGGILSYIAAVRAGEGRLLSAGLVRRKVPGGTYLVFGFSGEACRISDAYDYIFSTWMPGSRHSLRQAPSFVRFATLNGNGETRSAEIWIPVGRA